MKHTGWILAAPFTTHTFHKNAVRAPFPQSVPRNLSRQGLPSPLPEAAETSRRRRLLTKSKEVRYTPGTGFDLDQLRQTEDVTAPCTPSVLCDPHWDLVNDAVLDIYAINMKLGAMALCTGARDTCARTHDAHAGRQQRRWQNPVP
jgi:hypothetical protein